MELLEGVFSRIKDIYTGQAMVLVVDSKSEPDSHVCEGKQFICLKGLLAFTLAQRFRDTVLVKVPWVRQ